MFYIILSIRALPLMLTVCELAIGHWKKSIRYILSSYELYEMNGRVQLITIFSKLYFNASIHK